ncbi:HAD family hydrolase [Paeniglutamicibacter cryotolerans]|uniref:Putative hydrolase of the HAD superfamily n=1 Tax=Paeniglutamicibacter cryotolerans TaxID=670079 RepID=A0A839QU03_9MICC|nr:HAD family hydrolase [Paeniglutamicibacter cryotolerans]MBB2997446.1 putative hydrolase of the HAD superfamily [Paeniglutamicibacter cryotolerans]
MSSKENAPDLAATLHLAGVTRIGGVLFDIDDTLVDLRSAALAGFHRQTATDFAGVRAQDRNAAADDYARDGGGHYERYMAGELSFIGQRIERIHRAYAMVGVPSPEAAGLETWSSDYEKAIRASWAPFDDVHACLDELDALGIPYGAVSNNVEEYQRGKLKAAGLERITVLVGSDTAGAPKPDPRPFLAGAALLGTAPSETLYVGDNPINDVQGAKAAGLPALLLERDPDLKINVFGTLSDLTFLGLMIRGIQGF